MQKKKYTVSKPRDICYRAVGEWPCPTLGIPVMFRLHSELLTRPYSLTTASRANTHTDGYRDVPRTETTTHGPWKQQAKT